MSRSSETTMTAEAHISTVWRRGLLVHYCGRKLETFCPNFEINNWTLFFSTRRRGKYELKDGRPAMNIHESSSRERVRLYANAERN